MTATVRIPIFDRHASEVVVTDDPATALERAPAVRRVVLARMVAAEPVVDVLGTDGSH